MARKSIKNIEVKEEEIVQEVVEAKEESPVAEKEMTLHEKLAIAELEYESAIEVFAKDDLEKLIKNIQEKKEKKDQLFKMVFFGNKNPQADRVLIDEIKSKTNLRIKLTQGKRVDIYKAIVQIYDKIVRMSK